MTKTADEIAPKREALNKFTDEAHKAINKLGADVTAFFAFFFPTWPPPQPLGWTCWDCLLTPGRNNEKSRTACKASLQRAGLISLGQQSQNRRPPRRKKQASRARASAVVAMKMEMLICSRAIYAPVVFLFPLHHACDGSVCTKGCSIRKTWHGNSDGQKTRRPWGHIRFPSLPYMAMRGRESQAPGISKIRGEALRQVRTGLKKAPRRRVRKSIL